MAEVGAVPNPPDERAGRDDLSTYLAHVCRNRGGAGTARDGLLGILRERKIEARGVWGVLKPERRKLLANAAVKDVVPPQKVVCFTETPLSQLPTLLKYRAGENQHDFQPYGVALPDEYLRGLGANPVWYLSDGGSQPSVMASQLKSIGIAIRNIEAKKQTDQDLLALRRAPFLEFTTAMASYWHQREWRVVGDVALPPHFLVFAPSEDHAAIKGGPAWLDDVPLIDLSWSTDELIWRLAQFPVRRLSIAQNEDPPVDPPDGSGDTGHSPALSEEDVPF